MDYEEICSKILAFDPTVRYVAVFHKSGEVEAGGLREGIKGYFNEREIRDSMQYAVFRWLTREKLASKLEDPEWSITKYGKVLRVTLPINNNKLILVSAETNTDHDELVKYILELTRSRPKDVD